MNKIKKYLNDNQIGFEDKNSGFYSPYVKFMIDNVIYVITDHNSKYEICTIDRKMVKEIKTQKETIEYVNNIN